MSGIPQSHPNSSPGSRRKARTLTPHQQARLETQKEESISARTQTLWRGGTAFDAKMANNFNATYLQTIKHLQVVPTKTARRSGRHAVLAVTVSRSRDCLAMLPPTVLWSATRSVQVSPQVTLSRSYRKYRDLASFRPGPWKGGLVGVESLRKINVPCERCARV